MTMVLGPIKTLVDPETFTKMNKLFIAKVSVPGTPKHEAQIAYSFLNILNNNSPETPARAAAIADVFSISIEDNSWVSSISVNKFYL